MRIKMGNPHGPILVGVVMALLLGVSACNKNDQHQKVPENSNATVKTPITQETDTVQNEALQTASPQTDATSIKKITPVAPEKKLPKSDFKRIEWTDLMPKDDLEALLNPPSYVTDVEDGSAEDQIASQMKSSIAAASDDRYQQALVSTSVVPEMDGKAVRLPGYIVPLEFDDEQTVTQFFLVPFFGACIHVPPPPPNQVVLVNYPEGIKLDALYDPFWILGVLKVELTENDLATAAYTLRMQDHEEYTE